MLGDPEGRWGSHHRAHSEREVAGDVSPELGDSGRRVGGMSSEYFWILSLISPKGDIKQAVEFLGQELRGGVRAVSHPKWVIIDTVGVDEVASAWRELGGKKRLKMGTGFLRSMQRQAASGKEVDDTHQPLSRWSPPWGPQ